jgi:hypothetical protein
MTDQLQDVGSQFPVRSYFPVFALELDRLAHDLSHSVEELLIAEWIRNKNIRLHVNRLPEADSIPSI